MDEKLKSQLMWAALGFNITIVLFQFLFNWGERGADFTFVKLILGLLLSGAVGAGCFFAAKMTQR